MDDTDTSSQEKAPSTPGKAVERPTLEQAVLSELLAVRKTSEGLSPHAMAGCPTIMALLGDGDPLVAFTRLQDGVLERIELADDVTPIEAAAFSLGLASSGRTHLERLNAFGVERGYEARQARRHSDRGIRQLAALICSNWIVQTTPILSVNLTQQADNSLAVMVYTQRQRFVDMKPLRFQRRVASSQPEPWHPQPALVTEDHQTSTTTASQTDISAASEPAAPLPDDLWVRQHLTSPIILPSSGGEPIELRVSWFGEVWPCFEIKCIGALSSDLVVTSQTLGNTLVLAAHNRRKAAAK